MVNMLRLYTTDILMYTAHILQPAQHQNMLGPPLSIPPLRLHAGTMNLARYNDSVEPPLPTVAGPLSDPPPVNETKEESDDHKG